MLCLSNIRVQTTGERDFSVYDNISVFRHLWFPLLPRVTGQGDRDHYTLCSAGYEVSFKTPFSWGNGDSRPPVVSILACTEMGLSSWCFHEALLHYWPPNEHCACLFKETEASNDVLVTHLDCTILKCEHGFRHQLSMAGPLVLFAAMLPSQMSLAHLLSLSLSTVSNRGRVFKCFVKGAVASVLKFWPHSFLLFDPSCHPEAWLASRYNGEANACPQ